MSLRPDFLPLLVPFLLSPLAFLFSGAKDKGAKTIVIPGILSSKVSSTPEAVKYDDLKSKMIYLPGMVVPVLRTVERKDVPDGLHFGATTHKQLADLIDSWSLR